MTYFPPLHLGHNVFSVQNFARIYQNDPLKFQGWSHRKMNYVSVTSRLFGL